MVHKGRRAMGSLLKEFCASVGYKEHRPSRPWPRMDLDCTCLSGHLDMPTLDRLTLCRMPELWHTTEVRDGTLRLHFLRVQWNVGFSQKLIQIRQRQ